MYECLHIVCLFTLFSFYQSWLDICARPSQPLRCQRGARCLSLFLLTFLSVCLVYLERLCPGHQSFSGFRASFDFKEPWVVRSGSKHMKGKGEKIVLLPSRMPHYALRKELNIRHLNAESGPCLAERTS